MTVKNIQRSGLEPEYEPSLTESPPIPFAQTALEVFATGPRGTVLQLPVGDALTTAFLAGRLPCVIGVDISPQAMRGAKLRIEQLGLRNCTLMSAEDPARLPFLDSQFAGVFSADLLGHLPQPEPALREMQRVCRRGGHMVFDFMTPSDFTRRAHQVRHQGFYRYFDSMSLEASLDSAGIRPLSIERVSWEEDPACDHDVLHRRQSWVVVARRD
jgi:ubiquinone/menaquinone biosynthesis C-methylase UbiE